MLRLKDITKSYNGRKILDNITIEISKGDMIAVTGRSGSGKTTLLNVLGLLDKADSGTYCIGDKQLDFKHDLSNIRLNDIGFIVQNYGLLDDKNIFYNVALPLLCKKNKKKEISKMVGEVAEIVGISEHLKKYPYQISGGECQRAAIARAIIKKPKIILADEPTGALDEETENNIIELLLKLNNEGTTVLIATHNMNIANKCKRSFIIKNGKIRDVS